MLVEVSIEDISKLFTSYEDIVYIVIKNHYGRLSLSLKPTLYLPKSSVNLYTRTDGSHRRMWAYKNKYFLTFIDDYSQMTFVYFLKAKYEVSSRVRNLVEFVEHQTGDKIKHLRSDNGT